MKDTKPHIKACIHPKTGAKAWLVYPYGLRLRHESLASTFSLACAMAQAYGEETARKLKMHGFPVILE
jgi:hypothetical protein